MKQSHLDYANETHFDIAYKCIKANKHIFIENMLKSITEADRLIKSAQEKNYNSGGSLKDLILRTFSLNKYTLKPKYIEIQRLAPYNVRGTDVPVVLDKMIHDLDILLFLVNSDIEKIYAPMVYQF